MTMRRFVYSAALLAGLAGFACHDAGPVYIDHRNPEPTIARGHYTLTGSLQVRPDTLHLPEGVRPIEGMAYIGIKVDSGGKAISANVWRLCVDKPKNPLRKELSAYEKAFTEQIIPALADQRNRYDPGDTDSDSTTVVLVPLRAASIK